MTHASMSACDRLAARDFRTGPRRYSVGIENVEDLLADLEDARSPSSGVRCGSPSPAPAGAPPARGLPPVKPTVKVAKSRRCDGPACVEIVSTHSLRRARRPAQQAACQPRVVGQVHIRHRRHSPRCRLTGIRGFRHSPRSPAYRLRDRSRRPDRFVSQSAGAWHCRWHHRSGRRDCLRSSQERLRGQQSSCCVSSGGSPPGWLVGGRSPCSRSARDCDCGGSVRDPGPPTQPSTSMAREAGLLAEDGRSGGGGGRPVAVQSALGTRPARSHSSGTPLPVAIRTGSRRRDPSVVADPVEVAVAATARPAPPRRRAASTTELLGIVRLAEKRQPASWRSASRSHQSARVGSPHAWATRLGALASARSSSARYRSTRPTARLSLASVTLS